MLDQITGRPCANCESALAHRGPYCSADCRDEYEGLGAYVDDAPYRPLSRREAAPVRPTEDGALFTRGELVEAEALRRWKAEQIEGQLDIWDACAEVEAEVSINTTTTNKEAAMRTYDKGEPVIYQGSTWTVPAEGFVVEDTGERLTLRVVKPYYDPFGKWTTLRNVRRSSVRPARPAVEWPTGGALFDAEQLRGQLTLA